MMRPALKVRYSLLFEREHNTLKLPIAGLCPVLVSGCTGLHACTSGLTGYGPQRGGRGLMWGTPTELHHTCIMICSHRAGLEGVAELANASQGAAVAAATDASERVRRSVAATAASAVAKVSPADSGVDASDAGTQRSPTAADGTKAKARRTGEVSSPQRAAHRQQAAGSATYRGHVDSPGSASASHTTAAAARPAGLRQSLPHAESAAEFVRQESMRSGGGGGGGGGSGGTAQQADDDSGGGGRGQQQAVGEVAPGDRLPKGEHAPDDIEGVSLY